MTATVGGLVATFTAEVEPGPAALLNPKQSDTSASAGSGVGLAIRVTDAFGNPRAGDPVVWSVTGGGGSISGVAVTDLDGFAFAMLTVGATPGPNTATVTVGAVSATFTVGGVF